MKAATNRVVDPRLYNQKRPIFTRKTICPRYNYSPASLPSLTGTTAAGVRGAQSAQVQEPCARNRRLPAFNETAITIISEGNHLRLLAY